MTPRLTPRPTPRRTPRTTPDTATRTTPRGGRARRGRRERGSLSIELSILLPGFMAMAVLAIMFGRETLAQSAVDLAAHDAARAATVARTYPDAVIAAQNAATATLNQASTHCQSLKVSVQPATAFTVAIGQPSTVTVAVSCVVSLSDLAMPGMPGSVTVYTQFASPLDQYRTRS